MRRTIEAQLVMEETEIAEKRDVRARRREIGCTGCAGLLFLLIVGVGVFGHIKGDLDSIAAYNLVVENNYFEDCETYEELMALPFFSDREVTKYLEIGDYKYAELNHAMYYILFREGETRLLIFFYRNGFMQINRHLALRDTLFRDEVPMNLIPETKELLGETVAYLREGEAADQIEHDLLPYLERMSQEP